MDTQHSTRTSIGIGVTKSLKESLSFLDQGLSLTMVLHMSVLFELLTKLIGLDDISAVVKAIPVEGILKKLSVECLHSHNVRSQRHIAWSDK